MYCLNRQSFKRKHWHLLEYVQRIIIPIYIFYIFMHMYTHSYNKLYIKDENRCIHMRVYPSRHRIYMNVYWRFVCSSESTVCSTISVLFFNMTRLYLLINLIVNDFLILSKMCWLQNQPSHQSIEHVIKNNWITT